MGEGKESERQTDVQTNKRQTIRAKLTKLQPTVEEEKLMEKSGQ